MRAKVLKQLVLGSGAVLLVVSEAVASVLYGDGGVHSITTPLGTDIAIDSGQNIAGTTVNLDSGGTVTGAGLWNNARLNLNGGSISGNNPLFGSNVAAFGNTQVTMSDGLVDGQIQLFNNAGFRMDFGRVDRGIFSFSEGTIAIHGGQLGGDVQAGAGNLEITGGAFEGSLTVGRTTRAQVSGGTLGDYLIVNQGGVLEMSGGAFLSSGNANLYGDLDWSGGALPGQLYLYQGATLDVFGSNLGLADAGDGSWRLTGEFASGQALAQSIWFVNGADRQSVRLFDGYQSVPEPGSGLLLLGALCAAGLSRWRWVLRSARFGYGG